MRKFPAVLVAVVLGAAGFAAAGIASGNGLLRALTGTTASTSTPTTTTTKTETGEGGKGRKVALCHKTGSKKHPWQKISVSQSAVRAHLKHGDVEPPGPTTAASAKGKGKGKPTVEKPATTTATTTTSSDDGKGKGKGKGSDDHGNGGKKKP
jgi:hypothetical protein